jgi:hypothetical protein
VSTYLSAVAHHASHLTRAMPAVGYPDLEQYLELLLGPSDGGSAFDGDDSRRLAWRAHSSELMRLVEPGSRPWAWWEYDAPEPVRPRESDAAYLARCGLLTSAERISLAQAAAQPVSQATRNP